MERTYEIPTASGVQTVKAKSKKDALAMVTGATLKSSPSSLVKNVGAVTPTSGRSASTTVSPAPVITPQSLQSTETPISSLNVPTAQESSNLFSSISSRAESFANQIAPQTVDKATVNDAREGFFSKLLGRSSKSQLEANAYATEVDPAQKELNDIRDQIATRTRDYQKQIDDIEKNQRGMFGGGMTQEVNRIKQEATKELADLSIVENAKLNNYTAAKEIADRSISAQLEQEANEIDAWKLWYEENRNQFDKEDDRRFNVMLDERTRLFQEDVDNKKIERDTKLALLQSATSQGASADVLTAIQSAKTPEEAIIAAGQYSGDIQDRLEQSLRIKELNSKLAEYESANIPPSILFGTPGYSESVIANSVKYGEEGMTDSQLEKIQKSLTSLEGVENLNALLLQGEDGLSLSGPVTGKVRSFITKLGGDADAAAINAALQGLVPTLARGVFGEVGVLTNADIENYKKTLPNLTSSEDQNRLVSIILLDTLSRSIEKTLLTNAMNFKNTSQFLPAYLEVKKRVAEEKRRLGVTSYSGLDNNTMLDSVPTATSTPQSSNNGGYNQLMFNLFNR